MTGAAGRARQQRLARWGRRAPGYRAAVDTVLPVLRRNALLTDVVWRVFMPQHGVGTLPVPLHGGRLLTGRDTVYLPVVGILGLGLDDEQVDALVDQVAALQVELRAFRPVLILDRAAFAAARRHGYVLEVLVPREAWTTYPGAGTGEEEGPRGGSHAAYLGRRLADIVDHYQLWHLARAGADGLDPVDLEVLRAVPARLPDDLQVRAQDAGRPGDDPDAPPPVTA